MGLNKQRQYLVLCEDKQQQYFVRHFLKECNIIGPKVSFEPLPKEGSGEQYVRENYIKVLKKSRSKNRAITAVVVIDADTKTVTERIDQLKRKCATENIPERNEADTLMILVPKRNIESWIEYYSSGHANESDTYRHFENVSESKPAIIQFTEDIKNGRLRTSTFVSLQHAQKEYNRLCNVN